MDKETDESSSMDTYKCKDGQLQILKTVGQNTDGWTDRCTDGQTDEPTDGRKQNQMDRWTDGQTKR